MRVVPAIAALAAGLLIAGPVSALTCAEQAKEKKLAGAAQSSFLKKCEADSAAACMQQSAEKKLAGAAKKSFETKCVTEAVGKKS